jgi:hypothetical protein
MGRNCPLLVRPLCELSCALALDESPDVAEAEVAAMRAVDILHNVAVLPDPRLLDPVRSLAFVLETSGATLVARRLLRRLLELSRERYGAGSLQLATSCIDLALLLQRTAASTSKDGSECLVSPRSADTHTPAGGGGGGGGGADGSMMRRTAGVWRGVGGAVSLREGSRGSRRTPDKQPAWSVAAELLDEALQVLSQRRAAIDAYAVTTEAQYSDQARAPFPAPVHQLLACARLGAASALTLLVSLPGRAGRRAARNGAACTRGCCCAAAALELVH